ncbi:L-rhamnose mutarotase [Amphibacillus cookii]|uniref:L-rhamnose mutarotase n=1 Tax=Amphibacillus cookii TaxID=767787 RepID=UPI00195D5B76|nr:L-rhamnose mutarotase [Amphibacillus cookii]MBM7541574.1 L-rhamnose mutarotase [Amphibacillus cookii]
MLRKAFKMKVYPDQHETYHQRHQDLWPELLQLLKSHGVIKYAIYLDRETSDLFAYLEVEDESRWEQLATDPINKEWWAYMAPIMETNTDHSPKTVELSEMFYIEKEEHDEHRDKGT